MPPRYAYWTILIDAKPTAFRAREQAELLPTFHQLKRTNEDVVMRYFARGRLWDSPDQARFAATIPREKRGRDWRPGGEHKDPRARFREAEQARRQAKRKRHHDARERDRAFQPDHERSERQAVPHTAGRDRQHKGPRKPATGGRPDKRSFGAGNRKPWQKKSARPGSFKPADRRPFGSGKRKPWKKNESRPPAATDADMKAGKAPGPVGVPEPVTDDRRPKSGE